VFVLNAVNPDVEGWPQMIREATNVCRKYGPVAPRVIRERVAYIRTLNTGKTAPESSDSAQAKAAAAEIDGKRCPDHTWRWPGGSLILWRHAASS
jgi:hypothetical protein